MAAQFRATSTAAKSGWSKGKRDRNRKQIVGDLAEYRGIGCEELRSWCKFLHSFILIPSILQFLKVALSRQFCENLLAHPRRKLIHEGPLTLVGQLNDEREERDQRSTLESGRLTDVYAFLFNDMFLLTKTKKCPSKIKVVRLLYSLEIRIMNPIQKGTSIGKTEHYIVQKQPVPLDSCVFCDADSAGEQPTTGQFTCDIQI